MWAAPRPYRGPPRTSADFCTPKQAAALTGLVNTHIHSCTQWSRSDSNRRLPACKAGSDTIREAPADSDPLDCRHWASSLSPRANSTRGPCLHKISLDCPRHNHDLVNTPDADLLPDFADPPVVEVAVSVQFRPLFGLRPIELSPLRELWRAEYPLFQEQPPLPPTIERPSFGGSTVELMMGPSFQTRLWFMSSSQAELVQVQHDRLTVNWRQIDESAEYPRFPAVKDLFEQRWQDLANFVREHELGAMSPTQVELNYINAFDPGPDQLGHIETLLQNWHPTSQHHLGAPEQGRLALVFRVPGLGTGPVRLYVAADPAQRPDGRPVLFLTLTIRGAPADETLDSALRFIDEAHRHIVRSFAELTPQAMHTKWGRRQ
jgi:uncharacterized protein (TIGR04255 family)